MTSDWWKLPHLPFDEKLSFFIIPRPHDLVAELYSDPLGKIVMAEFINMAFFSGHVSSSLKLLWARNPVQVTDGHIDKNSFKQCIELKKSIVEAAPSKEAGLRKLLLNLGHATPWPCYWRHSATLNLDTAPVWLLELPCYSSFQAWSLCSVEDVRTSLHHAASKSSHQSHYRS